MKKFRCCFLTNHLKRDKVKYYREWMSGYGWGVMLAYDTIMAHSEKEARSINAGDMYAADFSFEYCYRVKKEHLHLDDNYLSEIYGHQESGDRLLYGGDPEPSKWAYERWVKRLIQSYKDYLLT